MASSLTSIVQLMLLMLWTLEVTSKSIADHRDQILLRLLDSFERTMDLQHADDTLQVLSSTDVKDVQPSHKKQAMKLAYDKAPGHIVKMNTKVFRAYTALVAAIYTLDIDGKWETGEAEAAQLVQALQDEAKTIFNRSDETAWQALGRQIHQLRYTAARTLAKLIPVVGSAAVHLIDTIQMAPSCLENLQALWQESKKDKEAEPETQPFSLYLMSFWEQPEMFMNELMPPIKAGEGPSALTKLLSPLADLHLVEPVLLDKRFFSKHEQETMKLVRFIEQQHLRDLYVKDILGHKPPIRDRSHYRKIMPAKITVKRQPLQVK